MLRWVTEFIHDNHENWEKKSIEEKKKIHKELDDWEKLKDSKKLQNSKKNETKEKIQRKLQLPKTHHKWQSNEKSGEEKIQKPMFFQKQVLTFHQITLILKLKTRCQYWNISQSKM